MALINLYRQGNPFTGLVAVGGKDHGLPGTLRRARGVNRLQTATLRSRVGATQVTASLDAHSVFRYNDVRFAGAGTVFYRAGSSIKTGLDGNRLTFLRMPPQADLLDYLFVAGGGDLFKVDSTGAVTQWGIAAPPDGFTATKGTQLSKVIDALDSQATWTGASVTLADEATIKQEGSNSLRMTVTAGLIGTASKAIAVDLTQFASGPTTSLDEDYIHVWVRIDNPNNLDYLEVQFDVSGGAFATDFYSKTIVAADVVKPEQLNIQQNGLGDFFTNPDQEGDIVELQTVDGQGNPSGFVQTNRASILDALGQTTVPPVAGIWTRLRLPKATFTKSGTSANDWSDVVAARLVVKANGNGTVIVYWDDLKLIGSAGLLGKYKYRVTFKNNTTGSRSNANPTPVVVENVERQPISLASLPISSDAQVNRREIWRTVGNGALYFLVTTINDNSTTTYTDRVADYDGFDSVGTNGVLQNVELFLDNDPPEDTYDFVYGPFDARAWWCGDGTGRVYYSAIGRPESVDGFLEVSNPDDPVQAGVIWNGNWVFTESKLLQILGTGEVYTWRVVTGVPGTTKPHTVVATPYGIFYESVDGPRLFNGATADLVGFDALGPLFQGEALENLTAFSGTWAEYARDEVLYGDLTQTLAYCFKRGAWRDLGVAVKAAYYEKDTQLLLASLGGAVVTFEDEGVFTDNGTAIPFAIEFPSKLVNTATEGLLQRLYLDINTNGQSLTPTLLVDGTEVAVPPFSTASRAIVEIAFGQPGRLLGLRLEDSLTLQVEVFAIDVDVYATVAPIAEGRLA